MTDRRRDNLGYFFSDAVPRFPGKTAIIDLSGTSPREVTYRELDARHDRMAALLTARGLKPGHRFAMAVGNRFEFVEIMYGAMRAGIVPVPLNTRLGADTLDYIMRDAGCVAAVVDAIGLSAKIALDPVPTGWERYESVLQATTPRFDPPELSPEHMSFLPYTSGSTGRPKGVILTHGGQLWWIRCVNKYWPSIPEYRALAAVPLYHKNAMAGAVKPMLPVGGSVVILPNFEPRRFLQVLSQYRCTVAGGVPAVFTLLLQQKDLIESLDFSALKGLKIGSAPVQEELMAAVQKTFKVPVGESYGLTEGGPVMIGPPLDGRKAPFGSCGVAWPEGEVKIVDSKGKDSDCGELWVKNPGVTPGYYQLPEVNRQRLVDGWLRTGDLFSRDKDGFYFFRGRTDDMFKSGGESVYPKEVENLLLTHPDVADVSVVPLPHPTKGEVPVAMVVLAQRAAATIDDLKTFCLKNGPAYAHPRRVLLVPELPLNGAAKTDRLEVKRRLVAEFGAEIGSAA